MLKTIIAGTVLAVSTGATFAQQYPIKPIRVSEGLGQPVPIDNRPAGGTILGAELAAHAVPDGYTIFMGSNTSLSINPNPHAKLPYDPVRDFAPITRIVVAANMLVVHPSMPVRSVKELAAFAKARPDQLNYGSSGTGTPEALAAQIKRELVLYASIIKKSGMKVY